MHQVQRSWVRSQHPSAQWNLRGGRWSSAEYSMRKKFKKSPKKKKKKINSTVNAETKKYLYLKPKNSELSNWMGGILMPGSGQFCSNNIFIKKSSRLQEFTPLFKCKGNRHGQLLIWVRKQTSMVNPKGRSSQIRSAIRKPSLEVTSLYSSKQDQFKFPHLYYFD